MFYKRRTKAVPSLNALGNGRCSLFPWLNDLGPATCLQAVAPEAVSRRNSLPPLNATASVQAPQSVQCILHKRALAVLRNRTISGGMAQLRHENILPASCCGKRWESANLCFFIKGLLCK